MESISNKHGTVYLHCKCPEIAQKILNNSDMHEMVERVDIKDLKAITDKDKRQKEKIYREEYRRRPDVKERIKNYYNKQEVIDRRKNYCSRLDIKERKKLLAKLRRKTLKAIIDDHPDLELRYRKKALKILEYPEELLEKPRQNSKKRSLEQVVKDEEMKSAAPMNDEEE